MTAEMIDSADGTRIAAMSMGNPDGPPVLFIHGWAQQYECWGPVMARMAADFHCVAMDLRGHGASDKPEATAAYTSVETWAGDVAAVIAHFKLTRPVLVGWSYGSRVVAAYLADQGSGHLGGVVLAGGIVAIGAAREDWMVGSASPGLNRDLYTEDVPRRLAATIAFVSACTTDSLPRDTFAALVGANMLCPAHVRRALFAADLDFRDVYAAMDCPGLVIHGTKDVVVSPATGQCAAELMPKGRYLPYEGLGHAPFLEDPARFSTDLAAFVEEAA